MKAEDKTILVLAVLAGTFISLAFLFRQNFRGTPPPLPEIPLVDGAFTNAATVRVSLPELIRRGGDASDYQCNSCHEAGKPGKLEFDAEGHIVLPGGHTDLVMKHGRNHRNENCFNCHNQADYTTLLRRDGRVVKLEESTQLCAGCHGPNFRDLEVGIHGRTSGYWNRAMGPAVRKDCVDCHDPHASMFPQIKPAPGPHLLHPIKEGKERVFLSPLAGEGQDGRSH